MTTTRAFPHEPQSVPAARRFATNALRLGHLAELQELLAAERTNRSAILERLPARHELKVLNVGATFDGVAG